MTNNILVNREIEIWKDILDCPGYMICYDGRVWNKKSGKFLKPIKDNHGYLFVNLKVSKGERKIFRIHILVLNAFIGKRSGKEFCCNHKDTIKANNCVENLEWVTYSENSKHAFRMGCTTRVQEFMRNLGKSVKGEKSWNAKLTEKDVREIRDLLQKGCYQQEIADMYSVSRSTIEGIKLRRLWGWLE